VTTGASECTAVSSCRHNRRSCGTP
jgi:hypothetical protein